MHVDAFHQATVQGVRSVQHVGNEGQQVGHTHIHAALVEQGAGLAPVVGLVVEKVGQQRAKCFALLHARHVDVRQRLRDVRSLYFLIPDEESLEAIP